MGIDDFEVIDSFSFDAGYRVHEMAHIILTCASKAKTAFIPVVLLTKLAARTRMQAAGVL